MKMETIYKCTSCNKDLDGYTGDWWKNKFYCPTCRSSIIAAEEDERAEIADLREQDIKRIVRERHCSRDEAAVISNRNW